VGPETLAGLAYARDGQVTKAAASTIYAAEVDAMIEAAAGHEPDSLGWVRIGPGTFLRPDAVRRIKFYIGQIEVEFDEGVVILGRHDEAVAANLLAAMHRVYQARAENGG